MNYIVKAIRLTDTRWSFIVKTLAGQALWQSPYRHKSETDAIAAGHAKAATMKLND